MLRRSLFAFLTFVTISAQVNAVPVKTGDSLHVLTQGDIDQIDAGAYCEAKMNGKTVYFSEASGRGVIRYENTRYLLVSEEGSKFMYEASRDNFYEIPNDNLPPFSIEIRKVLGARTVQSDEESSTTPAQMIIRAGNGSTWGTYAVLWTCGA